MKYFKMILVTSMIFLIGFSFLFFPSSQNKIIEINALKLEIGQRDIILKNNKSKVTERLSIEEGIKEYDFGDITGDGNDELIILSGDVKKDYGKEVIVFAIGNSIKEIGRKDFKKFNPWKVITGDIDGNGLAEISVGVYKESPLHPVMAKRPFIYTFVDGEIQPKWRGSRLSRPFTDYCFFDLDGDGIDEIIAIELVDENKKIINSYKWKGFGFEGYLESESYDNIMDLSLNKGIYINIKEGKESYKGFLKLAEDSLKIERVN